MTGRIQGIFCPSIRPSLHPSVHPSVHPFICLASYSIFWLGSIGLEALTWGPRPEALPWEPCPQGAGLGVLASGTWPVGPALEALA